MWPAPRFVELQDEFLRSSHPGVRFYTSLEGENPTGSIKDRMVHAELTELIARGTLRPGDWVSEVSAGSTARSLAYFCKELGLRCAVFVPIRISAELGEYLESQGAEVHRVEPTQAYEEYGRFLRERGTHPFNQLGDATQRRHYHAFGKALKEALGDVAALIGAVGTGHSLLGAAESSVGKARAWSAEPLGFAVSGVRNLDQESHGEQDCCRIDDFGRRILVPSKDIFKGIRLVTEAGPIEISDSFRVVLGAVHQVGEPLELKDGTRIFLLGSSNRKAPI